jgi:hypothetical protein
MDSKIDRYFFKTFNNYEDKRFKADKKDLLNENKFSKVKEIIIKARDGDLHLIKLLNHIKHLCAIGHSFEILVDPKGDKESKNTFYMDGDGSDKIESIMYDGSME